MNSRSTSSPRSCGNASAGVPTNVDHGRPWGKQRKGCRLDRTGALARLDVREDNCRWSRLITIGLSLSLRQQDPLACRASVSAHALTGLSRFRSGSLARSPELLHSAMDLRQIPVLPQVGFDRDAWVTELPSPARSRPKTKSFSTGTQGLKR